MTPTKDPNESEAIPNEIDRTMAEAEAALDAMSDDVETEVEEDTVEIEDPNADAARIAELEASIATAKDKWLRAVADLDNYRKRAKRDIDDAVMRKTQTLLSSFLPTVDNLERAMEIADTAVAEASDTNESNVSQVLQGIKMVRDEFLTGLKKHGIEPIAAVGLAFDPAQHDALQQIDSPDHAPGTVVREFERGYLMGERLLRPARVIVAGAGSTGGDES